jgi:uncharacterized protein
MDTAHNDLTFNVAQLLKESVGSTRNLKINTPTLVLSDQSIDPDDPTVIEAHDVKGDVKVTRVSHDLLVQGDVSADVDLECSRCLDHFSLPVSAKLEEKYLPTVDVETGRAVSRILADEDDTAFDINANHEIDLTEPVRQALLVSLPMRPLCREDCAGLCPTCGKNLNDGPCDCEPETVDNRWASLQELKIEDFPSGDGSLN